MTRGQILRHSTTGSGGLEDRMWLGVYDAQVAVATDPTGQGRVRLTVPQVLGNTQSNWAFPMQPGLTPALGTPVFCIFLGGNPDIPYYFLGLSATTLQNITSNTGLVLNTNPYFTGNVITGWTGTGGTVTAVQPNPATNPPFTYGIEYTSTGTGGGLITEQSALISVGPNQPYMVNAWVYYPAGGNVSIGLGFETPAKTFISNITNSFAVAANTWTSLQTVVTSPATAGFGYPVVGPATSTAGQLFTAEAVQVIGQIPGSLIQAQTVTPTQVAGGILNPNPYFAGSSTFGWQGVGGTLTATATPPAGSPYPFAAQLVISSGTNDLDGSPQPFGAKNGNSFQLTGWVYCSTSMTVNFGFGWANSSDVFNVNTTQSFAVAANTWTHLQTVQTANTSTATGYGYAYISSTSSSGTLYGAELIVSLQVNGTIVAPATLTGTQVAASTITGGNVAATTITGGNIAGSTITGGNVASSTITGGNVASGTITASNIAANTITASQIAANTITASQIFANTITAAQIAANTITAAQIAAGTITAAQISASIVIAGIVNGTTITGAQIVADGTSGQVLIYSGTPAKGNLVCSISGSATTGTDAHSNVYPSGLGLGKWSASTGLQISGFIFDQSGTMQSFPSNAANSTIAIDSSSGGGGYLAGYNAASTHLLTAISPATTTDTNTGAAIPGGLSSWVFNAGHDTYRVTMNDQSLGGTLGAGVYLSFQDITNPVSTEPFLGVTGSGTATGLIMQANSGQATVSDTAVGMQLISKQASAQGQQYANFDGPVGIATDVTQATAVSACLYGASDATNFFPAAMDTNGVIYNLGTIMVWDTANHTGISGTNVDIGTVSTAASLPTLQANTSYHIMAQCSWGPTANAPAGGRLAMNFITGGSSTFYSFRGKAFTTGNATNIQFGAATFNGTTGYSSESVTVGTTSGQTNITEIDLIITIGSTAGVMGLTFTTNGTLVVETFGGCWIKFEPLTGTV